MNEMKHIDAMDALLYAAMPYIKNREAEEINTTEPLVTMSDRNYSKLKKRLRRVSRYQERHEFYNPVYEGFKRVAIIILLVMSVGFSCVISIDAVRSVLWETIVEWYEQCIEFRFNTSEEIDTLEQIVDYREPEVPEAYTRTEILKNDFTYQLEYDCDDSSIMYTQNLFESLEIYESNHDTSVEKIRINNCDGYFLKAEYGDLTQLSLIWNDNRYVYHLSGNVSKELLIKIAQSIK